MSTPSNSLTFNGVRRAAIPGMVAVLLACPPSLAAQPADSARVAEITRLASRERVLSHNAGATRRDSAAAVATNAAVSVAPALGRGTIAVGGEIQFGYTDGWSVAEHTFRIRRVDLRLAGRLSPRLAWSLQADAAKALGLRSRVTTVSGERVVAEESINQASRTLQDALLTFTGRPWLLITAGQGVLPFTAEGTTAPGAYDVIEPAMFISERSRGGGVAAVRDVGLSVGGVVKTHTQYRIGVYNSSGDQQNAADANVQKSVVGRVVVQAGSHLKLGASGVYGGPASPARAVRDRGALEAQLRWRAASVRIEGVAVRDSVSRAGGYGQLAVQVRPHTELLARLDQWDPDRRREGTAADVIAREQTLGVTQTADGGALRLQLNLAHRMYRRHVVPTRTTVTAQVQVAW